MRLDSVRAPVELVAGAAVRLVPVRPDPALRAADRVVRGRMVVVPEAPARMGNVLVIVALAEFVPETLGPAVRHQVDHGRVDHG